MISLGRSTRRPRALVSGGPAFAVLGGGGVRSGAGGGAAPESAARAKALLFAAGRLAAFAERVGLALDGALLSGAVIERFVLVGCDGLSPASARTLRTNLRALWRSLERYPQPVPAPLPRGRAKQPYSSAEIEGYLRLARSEGTRRRRMRATALICLGAARG